MKLDKKYKIQYCSFVVYYYTGKYSTLTHGYLKVHGGVPIVLCMFVDPLYSRINCLVFK